VRVYQGISEGRKGSVGKVTDEVRTEVMRLHRDGHGVVEIARRLCLDRKQVSRALAHEGITNAPSTPASSRLPEILALRRQGVSIAEIGRRLGFSRKAVSRALAGAKE
jgi:DNA-binding NarL/FixJ family response regulator